MTHLFLHFTFQLPGYLYVPVYTNPTHSVSSYCFTFPQKYIEIDVSSPLDVVLSLLLLEIILQGILLEILSV